MVIDSKELAIVQAIKRSGFGLLLLSMILTMMTISSSNPAWPLSMLPLFLILPLITFCMYFNLKSPMLRIEEATKKILFIGFSILNFSILLFLVLLSLRLEEIINIGWGYLFIPSWGALGISFLFLIYLVPYMATYETDMKREAATMVLWFAGLLVTSILYPLHLESNTPSEPYLALLPLLIAGIIHAVTFIIPVIKSKRDPSLPKINPIGIELFIFGTIIPTIVITILITSVTDAIPVFVVILPLLKVAIMWMVMQEKQYSRFKKEGYQYIDN